MKLTKKMNTTLGMALIALLLTATPALAAAIPSGFSVWTTKATVDVNKTWQVKFSMPVDPATVNSSTIYVTDGDNQQVGTTLTTSDDKKSVDVKPAGAYALGKVYRLYITSGVKSAGGESSLSTQVAVPFVITDANSKIMVITSSYSTFLTSITVITSPDVFSVKADGEEMLYQGNNTYNLGLTGLEPGESITIKAYDEDGSLLESKNHTI